MWLERHTKAGNNELILAPLKAASEKADPVYNYLKRIEKEKTTNEITRLLYVAATRAKESFHLLTSLNKEDPQSPIKLPPKGSFAEILWPVCQEAFEQSIIIFDDTLPSQKGGLKLLRRLTSDWAPPFILKTLPSAESKPLTPFTPASSKRLGIVIHETLERIANEGLESWDKERIENNKSFWQRRLIQLGTSPEQLAHYLNGIITAVSQTLCDAKGRWILSHRHNQKSEYPITLVEDKKSNILLLIAPLSMRREHDGLSIINPLHQTMNPSIYFYNDNARFTKPNCNNTQTHFMPLIHDR